MTPWTARLCSLLLLGVLVACEDETPYHHTLVLPSGKEVKVIALGSSFSIPDEPALMLRYETNLSIDDASALEQEVDEVWSRFVHEVERVDATRAIIRINEVSTSQTSAKLAASFSFKKRKDGSWEKVKNAS